MNSVRGIAYRHDGEEQIAIGVEDEAGRHEGGDARHDAIAGIVGNRAHGDVVEAEIGLLRLDARRGIELHVRRLLGEVELGASGRPER